MPVYIVAGGILCSVQGIRGQHMHRQKHSAGIDCPVGSIDVGCMHDLV